MTPPAADLPLPTCHLLDRVKSDPASILVPASQTHKNLFISHAPGQLDVLGGDTACIGGTLCTFPIGVAATVAVQRRDDQKILIKNYPAESAPASPDDTLELSLGDFYGTAALLPLDTLRNLFPSPRRWAASVAGVFPILARHKKITRRSTGANIVCTFSRALAPLGASTALTCAALSAITAAYHLILEPLEIALLAERVQLQIAGVTCGQIADDLTAVLARENHVLLIKAQSHQLLDQLPLPPSLRLFAIALPETPVAAPNAATAASAQVAQQILSRMYRDLGIKKDPTAGYLANVSPALYRRYFRGMLPEQIPGREFLSEFNPEGDPSIHPDTLYTPRAAADHLLAEIDRVTQFAEALRQLPAITDAAKSRQAAIDAALLLLDSPNTLPTHKPSPAATLLHEITKAGHDHGLLAARLARTTIGTAITILAEASDAPYKALSMLLKSHPDATLLTDSHPGAAEAAPIKLPLATL